MLVAVIVLLACLVGGAFFVAPAVARLARQSSRTGVEVERFSRVMSDRFLPRLEGAILPATETMKELEALGARCQEVARRAGEAAAPLREAWEDARAAVHPYAEFAAAFGLTRSRLRAAGACQSSERQ
jgi:hypothetical protein